MRGMIDGGQLELLSRDHLKRLHLGVLEILREVGVKVEDREALEILNKAGAEVDFKEMMVKIPEYLVMESIQKAPKNVTFYGRDPNESFSVKGGKGVYFGPCAGPPYFIDENGTRRRGKLTDMEKSARVADALPNIDFVTGLTTASDVSPSAIDLYEQFAVMSNTKKHVHVFVYKGGAEMIKAQIELASLFAGSEEELSKRPIFSFYVEPASPLYVGKGLGEAVIEAAKLKIPVIYTPIPLAGATNPVTIAGTVIESVAESLVGNVIAQLVNPGTPVVLGPLPLTMEMRRGTAIYTNIESVMMRGAMAQLFRYYELPSWGTAGCTDSKLLDEQATSEAMLTLITSALTGNNLNHDVGYAESGKSGSIALLTIADEMIGMVKRLIGGIRVDDETLALDAIKSAGVGGSFLTLKHTLNTYTKEHTPSELFDRLPWDAWVKEGGKTLVQRGYEKVNKILREHEVEPISADVRAKAKEIIKRFEG
ncbi:MAG: Trimethylamine methyltransferase MttB [Candidatus Methanolliviera sp. GoM_oil]|nr:MAG: Trimethylamine methyltransferase MttB [Candidatus Methanolliviera sp. GoM_oil]